MMSTEDNKATVRHWIEEGGNQGNVAVFDELSAPNWVYHDPNFPDPRTLADYKRSITEARSAFPDFSVETAEFEERIRKLEEATNK